MLTFSPAFKSHFLLVIRWVHLWNAPWGVDGKWTRDQWIQGAIKLNILDRDQTVPDIRTQSVCHQLEWVETGCHWGLFMSRNDPTHTHTKHTYTRTQIYSLTWPRWLKQSLRTGGAQVIRPSLVYQFSCNHFICKHGKVGTVMRHGLSLEACSKTWLFTLFIPAHAHLYSFSFDIFPRFNLIKFCFSCEDLWKRFICQLASCSPV